MTLTTLSELEEIIRVLYDTERCVQCITKRLLAILEKQKRKDSCQSSVASRLAKAAANEIFLIPFSMDVMAIAADSAVMLVAFKSEFVSDV